MLFFNNAGYSVGDYEKNIKAISGIDVRVDMKTEVRSGSGYIGLKSSPIGGLDNIYSASPTPLFYVDDKSAVSIDTIAGTNKTGAAMKKFDDWTGVYLSLAGVISPEFIRELAKLAKVTPVGPPEDVTYAGNGFLVIHAMTPGEKTLRWEVQSDLFDISAGTTVDKGVESYTLNMSAFETRWFKRRPVK